MCDAGVRVDAVRSRLCTVHRPWVAAVRSAVPPAAQLRTSHRTWQDSGRPRRNRNYYPATQLPWLLRRLRRKCLFLVAGQSAFRWLSERCLYRNNNRMMMMMTMTTATKNNKIAFQWKADHPRMCVFSCPCVNITLIRWLDMQYDLDTKLRTWLRYIEDVPAYLKWSLGQSFQKLEPEQDKQTHRHVRPNSLPFRNCMW